MRLIFVLVVLSTVLAAPTSAAELQVVCPPLVRDGMKELAAAYTQRTGMAVAVRSDVMGKIMGDIETGVPAADVVLLPPDLMDALAKNDGLRSGTRVTVGRVEIALAVRAGASHPDISTVGRVRAVLQGAKDAFLYPARSATKQHGSRNHRPVAASAGFCRRSHHECDDRLRRERIGEGR